MQSLRWDERARGGYEQEPKHLLQWAWKNCNTHRCGALFLMFSRNYRFRMILLLHLKWPLYATITIIHSRNVIPDCMGPRYSHSWSQMSQEPVQMDGFSVFWLHDFCLNTCEHRNCSKMPRCPHYLDRLSESARTSWVGCQANFNLQRSPDQPWQTSMSMSEPLSCIHARVPIDSKAWSG